MPSVRRLTAILAADVAGYSRLMGADEEGTLHRKGIRYRVHCRPEPASRGRADIVFRSTRIAVFVDGCFWHGCPLHWKPPRRHADWWATKIAANAARDNHTTAALEARGWLVIRVWEHEDAEEAATRIAAEVRKSRNTDARPLCPCQDYSRSAGLTSAPHQHIDHDPATARGQ
jgi:DNA mismatch endonuclease (patch repair protein)